MRRATGSSLLDLLNGSLTGSTDAPELIDGFLDSLECDPSGYEVTLCHRLRPEVLQIELRQLTADLLNNRLQLEPFVHVNRADTKKHRHRNHFGARTFRQRRTTF